MHVGLTRSPGRNYRLRTPCPYPRALDDSFLYPSFSYSLKKTFKSIEDKKRHHITFVSALIWVSSIFLI